MKIVKQVVVARRLRGVMRISPTAAQLVTTARKLTALPGLWMVWRYSNSEGKKTNNNKHWATGDSTRRLMKPLEGRNVCFNKCPGLNTPFPKRSCFFIVHKSLLATRDYFLFLGESSPMSVDLYVMGLMVWEWNIAKGACVRSRGARACMSVRKCVCILTHSLRKISTNQRYIHIPEYILMTILKSLLVRLSIYTFNCLSIYHAIYPVTYVVVYSSI